MFKDEFYQGLALGTVCGICSFLVGYWAAKREFGRLDNRLDGIEAKIDIVDKSIDSMELDLYAINDLFELKREEKLKSEDDLKHFLED